LTKQKFLQPEFMISEKHEIHVLCSVNTSFYSNIVSNTKKDYTEVFMKEIKNFVYSDYPQNFIINITGGIGRKMGIFKSSLGMQLALEFYPNFNVNTHLAFSYEDLLLLTKNAKRNELFILDEQVRDRKQSAIDRLCNVIESCRERGLSFILIGVPEILRTVSDYRLERLGESPNSYLPNKTVYYSLSKRVESRKYYMGYIRRNITPLSNKNWKLVWDEYMEKKSSHQQKVLDGKITGFPIEEYANQLMKDEKFADCIIDGKLISSMLNLIVTQKFPDITNNERKLIKTLITDLNKKLNPQR